VILAVLLDAFFVVGLPGRLEAAAEIVRLMQPGCPAWG